jgi:hypothetical protein
MECQVSELIEESGTIELPTYPCAFCSFDHGTEANLCDLCMVIAYSMHTTPDNYSPIDLNAMQADNYRTNVVLAVLDHIAELLNER